MGAAGGTARGSTRTGGGVPNPPRACRYRRRQALTTGGDEGPGGHQAAKKEDPMRAASAPF